MLLCLKFLVKQSGIAVDTHCKRISNRIGLSNEKDPSKIEQDLLKQIDEKGYLIPYKVDHREVVKIGVEFSAESRNLSRWLVEIK